MEIRNKRMPYIVEEASLDTSKPQSLVRESTVPQARTLAGRGGDRSSGKLNGKQFSLRLQVRMPHQLLKGH